MSSTIEKATTALDSFFEKIEQNPNGLEARFNRELIETLDNQAGIGPSVQEYFSRFEEQYKHLS